jgi:hypothetical protein
MVHLLRKLAAFCGKNAIFSNFFAKNFQNQNINPSDNSWTFAGKVPHVVLCSNKSDSLEDFHTNGCSSYHQILKDMKTAGPL